MENKNQQKIPAIIRANLMIFLSKNNYPINLVLPLSCYLNEYETAICEKTKEETLKDVEKMAYEWYKDLMNKSVVCNYSKHPQVLDDVELNNLIMKIQKLGEK